MKQFPEWRSSGAGIAAALVFGVLAAAAEPGRAANDDARIQAVTEFLIDRAKENYLYIFEQRIARNDTVRCYFPTVFSYVQQGDLRIFLKSRRLWGESIRTDLENLLTRTAAKAAASADLRGIAMDATNRYAGLVQYLNVRYQGREFKLSETPFPKPAQDVVDFLAGFYRVNAARDFLLELDAVLKKAPTDPACRIPDLTRDEIKALAQKARSAAAELEAWRRHVATNASSVRVDTAKLDADCKQKPGPAVCAGRERLLQDWQAGAGSLAKAVLLANKVADGLQKYEDDWDKAENDTERVLLAIRLMRDTPGIGDDEMVESLKRHVLFFAEISDAKTTEQVKLVLEEYTLPAVSFGVKREVNKGHAMITAYLGYAYGTVTNSGDTLSDDNNQGIYAPIGLEVSWGGKWLWAGDSISLMLSPFDFGYPVSLKLNGVKEELELEDIVAPSVALSYGLARYPVTVGAAYQWGRKSPSSNEAERRLMLFIGFDMPLFPLF